MATLPGTNNDLLAARTLGMETCGRIAAFWGFTRTMGRAFGLLYLSPASLSRADVQEQLQISVGSASMTLSALVRWGVVKKLRDPGKRLELYEAETDFWKMISGVLNERERKEIRAATGLVEKACHNARAAKKHSKSGAKKEAGVMLDRLEKLSAVCRVGETMLDMLLGNAALDLKRFRDVLATPTAKDP